MPFIDQLQEPVTQQDSWTQSLAMARAYRRLLFSDLDRARAVVATLQRWSYDRVQDLSECLTLGFRETAIQESFAIRDVDCRVIAAVGERSLAGYLWQMGNELPVNEPPARWACKWSPGDYMTLVTVTQVDRRGFKTYGAGQRLRDALFTARSTTWPYVLEQIGAHFGAPYKSEPDLETQLRSGELDDTTRQRVRAEPWRLAAVNEGAIIAYLQSFESSVPSLPGDEVPRPAGVRRNARPAPGRVDTKTSAGHRRKQTAKSKERGKRGQAKKTARPKVAKRATPGKNAKGKKKRKRTP